MSPGPKELSRLRPQGSFFQEKQTGGLGQKMLSRMQPETIMDSSLAHSGLSWFQGKMVNMESNPE